MILVDRVKTLYVLGEVLPLIIPKVLLNVAGAILT